MMNEVAFPVMDLHHHGLPRLAHRFVDAYLDATGDFGGLETLRFYLVYRAMVRAKVSCIRAHQRGRAGRRSASARRRAYAGHLALANGARPPRRSALMVMHGLSGSGKSTLSQALVEALGAIRLRSDVERKRLHGLAAGREDAIRPRGRHLHAAGRPAHLRPAGGARGQGPRRGLPGDRGRDLRAERLARAVPRASPAERQVPFLLVACAAPEATLRERVDKRSRGGGRRLGSRHRGARAADRVARAAGRPRAGRRGARRDLRRGAALRCRAGHRAAPGDRAGLRAHAPLRRLQRRRRRHLRAAPASPRAAGGLRAGHRDQARHGAPPARGRRSRRRGDRPRHLDRPQPRGADAAPRARGARALVRPPPRRRGPGASRPRSRRSTSRSSSARASSSTATSPAASVRWAIVAAFGDNLPGPATALAATLHLGDAAVATLRELGTDLNYGACGETEADVLLPPLETYRLVSRHRDPFALRDEPFMARLAESRLADLANLAGIAPRQTGPFADAYVLPDAPWSRRVMGTFANRLANADPARAHAVLVPDARGLCGQRAFPRRRTACGALLPAVPDRRRPGAGRRPAEPPGRSPGGIPRRPGGGLAAVNRAHAAMRSGASWCSTAENASRSAT